MSENEKGYYIREFSCMTGLPQSKIRYYEKIGLFKAKRMKNGYRWFPFRGLLLCKNLRKNYFTRLRSTTRAVEASEASRVS